MALRHCPSSSRENNLHSTTPCGIPVKPLKVKIFAIGTWARKAKAEICQWLVQGLRTEQ